MLSERDLGGKNRICPKSVTILTNIGFQTKIWTPFLPDRGGGEVWTKKRCLHNSINFFLFTYKASYYIFSVDRKQKSL